VTARFTRTQYSPGLFDVTQDIVGALPIKLIEQWLQSEQTLAAALRLLASSRVLGYNVVSDSAGLTRLTQERGLMEILAMINQPKEIIHQLGTAIGGRGIGIWAADNTQMFYPDEVDASALVSALLTIQDAVRERCAVEIGLAAHHGEFYAVSGGMYGEASEAIEAIAENETVGGEVVITRAIAERLPPGHGFVLAARDDPHGPLGQTWRVCDGPRSTVRAAAGGEYPIPYSREFHADLVAFAGRLDDARLARAMGEKYTLQRVVVLIERASEAADSHEVALFNNLALSAMMKDAGLRHLNEEHGVEVKVAGPIGIYTFEDPALALGFAETFRRELAREGIEVRIGVDAGPVVVFALAGGGMDIAGGPVNIASKLAQDCGAWGKLYLGERLRELALARGFRAVQFAVSGVEIAAFEG